VGDEVKVSVRGVHLKGTESTLSLICKECKE